MAAGRLTKISMKTNPGRVPYFELLGLVELWDAENRGENRKALSITTTDISKTAFYDYKLSESTRPALNVKNHLVKKSDVLSRWFNILKYFHKFYQLVATNVDVIKKSFMKWS